MLRLLGPKTLLHKSFGAILMLGLKVEGLPLVQSPSYFLFGVTF